MEKISFALPATSLQANTLAAVTTAVKANYRRRSILERVTDDATSALNELMVPFSMLRKYCGIIGYTHDQSAVTIADDAIAKDALRQTGVVGRQCLYGYWRWLYAASRRLICRNRG